LLLPVAVVFLVALNAGPPLERWRMVGNHRIVPEFASRSSSTNNSRQEFQEL
jgi:hypothetical protein